MSKRWGGRQVAKYRALVIELYGTRCYWCSKPIDLTLAYPHPQSFSIEHLQARSKGGHVTDPANMRPAHLVENTSRGNREAPARPARTNPSVFSGG